MEQAPKRHSLETIYQIWDDKSGDRLEVGPDRDGLDGIEIRTYDSDGMIHKGNRVFMTREQAPLVRDALNKMLD